MFEAIILAGGFGTRLKSVSGDVPKPMVDVGGVPFLYRLMQALERQECCKIILSLHYKADEIIAQIEQDAPTSCKIEYAVEEVPLGTGGAIKHACQFVSGDRVIVLNGDTYCEVNYLALFNSSKESELVVLSVPVEDVSRYGRIEIDDELNILSMSEKAGGGTGFINAGTYVMATRDIIAFSEEIFSFEKDFIPSFGGSLKAFVDCKYFVDIGIPDDYFRACKTLG